MPGFVGTSRQTKRAFRQTPIRKERGFRKVPGLMGTLRHVTTDCWQTLARKTRDRYA